MIDEPLQQRGDLRAVGRFRTQCTLQRDARRAFVRLELAALQRIPLVHRRKARHLVIREAHTDTNRLRELPPESGLELCALIGGRPTGSSCRRALRDGDPRQGDQENDCAAQPHSPPTGVSGTVMLSGSSLNVASRSSMASTRATSALSLTSAKVSPSASSIGAERPVPESM